MQKNSILIIEDEQALNENLEEYMNLHFENVYCAFNGEEGLELYNKYKPDVIITDIHMPKLDGLSLVEKIRKTDKNIKIIILSAFTEKEKLFKAIELQLVTYLVKPFSVKDVEAAISTVKKQIKVKNIHQLSPKYSFNMQTLQLFDQEHEIALTKYEKKFLNLLLQKQNICVSHNDILLYVYDLKESNQNALASMVKRLRKKMDDNIIITCYKEGYKILIE